LSMSNRIFRFNFLSHPRNTSSKIALVIQALLFDW
jgi:hypothetical protein